MMKPKMLAWLRSASKPFSSIFILKNQWQKRISESMLNIHILELCHSRLALPTPALASGGAPRPGLVTARSLSSCGSTPHPWMDMLPCHILFRYLVPSIIIKKPRPNSDFGLLLQTTWQWGCRTGLSVLHRNIWAKFKNCCFQVDILRETPMLFCVKC